MIASPDLHPDDHRARLILRDQLRVVRREQNVTLDGLGARMGMSRNAAADMHYRPSWQVARAQAWSRALCHQFRLTPTGLTVPDTYDVRADLLTVAVPVDDADEDRLHLLGVCDGLVRVRLHQGLTTQAMADLLGVTDNAVRLWETHPAGSLVRTVQRYTRALGGVLRLDLHALAVAA